MPNRQEQELDAAEYVIGTLSVVERRAFEDLMASDAQTRQDVWYWERAFGALNVSISPEAPPANMWERIYYSLPAVVEQQKRRAGQAVDIKNAAKNLVAKKAVVKKAKAQAKKEKKIAKESAKIELETQKRVEREAQNKVERESADRAPDIAVSGATKPDSDKYVSHWWRKLAKLACIIALCLAAYTAFKPTEFVKVTAEGKTDESDVKQFYAVVNADWNLPSLVVRVNTETGVLKIDGTGIVSPKGKSLQIWHRSAENGRKPIGLLGQDPENFRLVAAKSGDVLEISIEPEGGALGDGPSGPIVYSGKLAKLAP